MSKRHEKGKPYFTPAERQSLQWKEGDKGLVGRDNCNRKREGAEGTATSSLSKTPSKGQQEKNRNSIIKNEVTKGVPFFNENVSGPKKAMVLKNRGKAPIPSRERRTARINSS